MLIAADKGSVSQLSHHCLTLVNAHRYSQDLTEYCGGGGGGVKGGQIMLLY